MDSQRRVRRRGDGLLVFRSKEVGHSLSLRLPAIAWPFKRREVPARSEGQGNGAARSSRVVVVVRVPQLALPRPNPLDLYVARTYLRMLMMSVVGIMGLFYISTFLDKSDKLFKGEVTLAMLLQFLWWETLQFLYYIIAIAVLLSAIVTIGLLTKNSELIVMRACGISLYRTAHAAAALCRDGQRSALRLRRTGAAFSNRRADYLNHLIKSGSPHTFDVINRRWVAGATARSITINSSILDGRS